MKLTHTQVLIKKGCMKLELKLFSFFYSRGSILSLDILFRYSYNKIFHEKFVGKKIASFLIKCAGGWQLKKKKRKRVKCEISKLEII